MTDDTVVGETATAAYDYAPAKDKKDHLALSKGESISILSKVSSEWWKGSNSKGQEGLFPSSYVSVAKAKIDEMEPVELKVKIAVKGKKFVGDLKFEGGATVEQAVRKVAKIAALPDEDAYAFYCPGGATFLQPSKTLRACGLVDKDVVEFKDLRDAVAARKATLAAAPPGAAPAAGGASAGAASSSAGAAATAAATTKKRGAAAESPTTSTTASPRLDSRTKSSSGAVSRASSSKQAKGSGGDDKAGDGSDDDAPAAKDARQKKRDAQRKQQEQADDEFVNFLDDKGRPASLHNAAWTGDDIEAFSLLDEKWDPNALDSAKAAPIHYAAYKGQLKVIKTLLRSGAKKDVRDADGCTALHHAAYHGHIEVCDYLCQKGARTDVKDNDGGTPIHNAAARGDLDVLKLLVAAGADPEQRDADGATLLHYAAFGGDRSAMKFLMSKTKLSVNCVDVNKDTPLHHAAFHGHKELVELLLSKGAEVNAKNLRMSTPLHNACFGGHADIVTLLIDKGADVSAADGDKETPLHKAAWAGSEQIMALLLDRGAKVDAKAVDGSTALHKAAYGGHLPCLFLLLECGAKINRQDAEGGTALHNAVYNGHVGCVDYLIKKGADINVIDARGAAVLHYAAFFGQRRITNLLLRKGANVGVVDQVGRTPLHLAAFKGNTFGMLLFLMAKAEVGCATDKGMTPMSFAAYSGNFASVMLLDQHGAQAKQKDEKGLTPLHLAALRGKSDVCAFLILKDAKLNARDDSGRTPLHYAARANNADVVSLLLENGAKLDVLDKNNKTAEQLAQERGDKCAAVNQFFHTILEDGKKYKEASYAEKINFLIPEVRRGRMSDFDRMNWLETDLDFGMGGAGGAGGAGGKGGVQINIDTSKRGKNAYIYEPLGIDINSASELAACVEAHARSIGVVSGWMNVLRHLIVVPYARVEVAQFMWKIIELFVHRVVVQKEDDDWENDRVRLNLETFERLHQDEPPLSEDETMSLLKSVLEALQVLFPGLEVPSGEDDGAEFKQRTEEEEEQIKLKREKQQKAKGGDGAKTSEARAARSVEEKLAHLMSDEDDFLPSIGAGEGGGDGVAAPTGGPPPPPGAPMPPPPPGMAQKLGPKLRRFNWIKIVVPKVPETIFKDMDPDKCFLDIEKKYLEGAYYVKDAKKLGEKGKFNQVNIVDLKRAQTIGILLARIKQPVSAIAEAIRSLDEKVLSLDDVRSLTKFSPTKDEVDSLKKYIEAGSDVSKLGQAEHFFLELMAIDNLAGRLSAWVFKREFDFKLADILADIEMVNNAVVELKKSAKFTKLLHVTLVLGNYMNGGYFGGTAKGFKLQSLLRLRDTKTADNKSNLLEHLIHLFETHDKEKGTTLMEWRDDMPNVFNGTKERLDLVNSNVEELKVSVAELEVTIQNEKDQQFINKLTDFVSKTGERMQMIIDSATKVRQRFETTSAYYGEDDPNDDFITFLGQFHTAWTEQIKTLQEKREKEEARQKKKRAFMPKAKREAMAGGTDTKFKRQMEDDDGMLFGVGGDDDGAIGGSGAGSGAGGAGAGPRSLLKSKRNIASATGTTDSRAKPKVVAIQAYNSDDDSEDSISFEGPLVGVKVATTLAGAAANDDSDDEVD